MAMNKQRRTANLNNIVTYDALKNVTLPADLTIEGLTGAGFVKADANGLLSVDTGAYLPIPSQTGNAGKFLSTDGSNISWQSAPQDVNIYSTDGTLTGNRTVTMGSYTLTFEKDLKVNNIRVGAGTGNTLTTGNTYLGYQAANTNFGYDNTAIGYQSLYSLQNFGSYNTAVGSSAGYNITSGRENAVFGHLSGGSITTGGSNTTVGVYAGNDITTGSNNVAVGYAADMGETGSYNVVVGSMSYVGGFTGGSNNTVIGSRINAYGNLSNHVYIGDGSGNMRLVFNASGDAVIGGSTTIPTFAGYKLDVLGTGRFTGNVTIHSQANPELLIQPNVNTGSARLKIYNSGSSALGIHIATGASDTGFPSQLRNMIGLISPYGYFISTNGQGAIGTSDIAIFAFNSKSVSFNSVTEYASAQVAIDSTTKGFLAPRMTNAQRTAISTPATGLMAYSTDATEGMYLNLSGGWQRLLTSGDIISNIYNSDGTLTGNRTVTMGGNSLTFSGGTLQVGNTSTWETYINSRTSLAGVLLRANYGVANQMNLTFDVNGYLNMTGANFSAPNMLVTTNLQTNGSVTFNGNNKTAYWVNVTDQYVMGMSGNTFVIRAASSSLTTGGALVSTSFTNGNISFGGTTDAGYKLDVQGTGRFTDDVIINKSSGTALLNIVGGSGVESQLRIGSQTANTKFTISANAGDFYIGSIPDVGNSTKIFTISRANTNVAIVNNSTALTYANQYSLLELVGTGKGFLPNRMTQAQMRGIAGAVNNVAIVNGGSGYTNGTYYNIAATVTTSYGTGTVVVSATVSGGVVTSLTVGPIPPYGSGYQIGDIITSFAGLTGGTGFQGKISGVTTPQALFAYQTDSTEGLYAHTSNNGWQRLLTSGDTIANIYNSNGTLTGNRTVTMGSFSLSFQRDITINGAKFGVGGGNQNTNVAIGDSALPSNTTGYNNVAIGNSALFNTTDGIRNVGIGTYVLGDNTIGSYNTAIGDSIYGTTTGNYNTFIGQQIITGNVSNNIILADGQGRMRLVFNSSGDAVLGGGTTYPTFAGYKLDVQGSGRFNSGLIVTGVGTEASPVILRVHGSDINTSGDAKVVIGQNLSGSDLQLFVAGTNTRTDGLTANDQYILSGQRLSLMNIGNGSAYNTSITIGESTTYAYGNIAFGTNTQNSAAITRMLINAIGNVGIGTTNPQRLLHIHTSTGDSHLQISGTAPSVSLTNAVTGSTYQAKFGLATAANNFATGSAVGDFVISNQAGNTIWAYNSVEGMRFTINRNLLLGGTSDSGKKLQVTGEVNVTSGNATSIEISNTAGNYHLLMSSVSVAAAYGMYISGSDMLFTKTGAASPNITIKSTNGDVVFGNTIKTAAPTGGTSQAWKLGQYNATAPSATGYVEVEVNGVLYKLLAST